jgi:hypothetical protein
LPEDVVHTDDPRILEVIEALHELWPERLSTRDEAHVRRTLAAGLPRRGDPDLSTPEGRRTMTATIWSGTDVRDGAPFRASPIVGAAVRLALGIDDAVAGRGSSDLSDEVSGRRATPPSTVRLARTSPEDGYVGPDQVVEFAFAWRPSPVGTRQRLGTAAAHVGVTTVDPSEAPIACSLWTPEGYLDVRRHGLTWLRPVLCPESWTPIGMGHFAEAAASGVAWRDSPFLPHTGRGRPTFDLGDYASPRALAKEDDRRIATARDACLARAGWLCVIDGVVHRTTGEPLAGMTTLTGRDAFEVGPVWSLGDIDSTCVMDTVDCFESVVGRWALGRVRPDPSARSICRHGLVPVAEWVGAVAGTPLQSPVPEAVASGRWPTAHGLVRLGEGAPDVSEPGTVLRAAAATSAVALTPAQSREALRGYGCEFVDLHVLLRKLEEIDLDPGFRRAILSYVEPSCDDVVDALPLVPEPVGMLWAYVVALARRCASCEAGQADEVEDLATLRL